MESAGGPAQGIVCDLGGRELNREETLNLYIWGGENEYEEVCDAPHDGILLSLCFNSGSEP